MLTRRDVLALAGATAASTLAGAAVTGPASAQAPASELAALLEQISTAILKNDPELCTSLAVTELQAGGPYLGRSGDSSMAGYHAYTDILKDGLARLRALDRNSLSNADKVTLEVVTTSFENDIDSRSFEAGDGATGPYIVTQLTGQYTEYPDFLDSQQPVTNRAQVDFYLQRLSGYAKILDQQTARIAPECAAGFTPPDFAIDKALVQLNTFTKDKPADTVLVASLVRRLADLAEVSSADRTALAARAETIVRDEVLPAYQRQIAALKAVRPGAKHDAGCYNLPNGEALYASALRNNTTTHLAPDEIHAMGLELVRGINAEMDQVLKSQGLTTGTLAERVAAVSKLPGQIYPSTAAGRQQLLDDLNGLVRTVRAKCQDTFGVQAKAALVIKRIPEYTEAGAPGGYYSGAALDGSRPGQYYINLRDMNEVPKYSLPTLTYHEGIPGHHWQISIQQEAQGLPFIRRALLGFNAYAEGWALYSEQLRLLFGLGAHEQPLCFLTVGTVQRRKSSRARPVMADYTSTL